MKRRTKSLLAAGCLVAAAAGGLTWWSLGRTQAIHAEVRTAAMEQAESAAPGGILQVQELLSAPVTQSGLTMHRAAYYPEAQALVCFTSGKDMFRDIYLTDLPDCNGTSFPDAYGISFEVFEPVPAQALAGGIVYELTDAQFESSNPVTFALKG